MTERRKSRILPPCRRVALKFVVEKHADGSAPGALDAGSLFLIEAIEIGVVFDFARFHQTVVDRLIVGKLVGPREKAVTSLRERQHAQSLLLRDFEGLVAEQRLSCEATNVLFHSLGVTTIGVLRQITHGDYAKLADFLQGKHFGIAEKISAITDVIRARRFLPFFRAEDPLPSLGAIGPAKAVRCGIPAASCVGRCRSAQPVGVAGG